MQIRLGLTLQSAHPVKQEDAFGVVRTPVVASPEQAVPPKRTGATQVGEDIASPISHTHPCWALCRADGLKHLGPNIRLFAPGLPLKALLRLFPGSVLAGPDGLVSQTHHRCIRAARDA